MLEFRLARPEDSPSCLELVRTGHDSTFSAERFDWLHRRGPWGPTRAALALSGERVVGMYSVLPKTVVFDGRTFRGARDVDPVVHPDFRGQGLFSRLLGFGLDQFEDLDFLFNFANPASAAGFRKFGWRDCAPLEDRVRQLGFSAAPSASTLLWVLGLANPAGRTGARTRMLDEDEFSAWLGDGFPSPAPGSTPGLAGVHRTAAYFRWRYLDHPMHRYTYFLAEGPDGPTGLAVCRHHREAGMVSVLDVVGFGSSPALGDWLVEWRGRFGTSRVVAWNSLPAPVLKGLLGNPFKKGRGQTFLVRELPGRETPAEILDSRHWYLTRGDLEIS